MVRTPIDTRREETGIDTSPDAHRRFVRLSPGGAIPISVACVGARRSRAEAGVTSVAQPTRVDNPTCSSFLGRVASRELHVARPPEVRDKMAQIR